MVFMIAAAAMAILGAALIVGGAVAYRASDEGWVRALSAGGVAAGLAMWALILFIIPVSVTRSG